MVLPDAKQCTYSEIGYNSMPGARTSTVNSTCGGDAVGTNYNRSDEQHAVDVKSQNVYAVTKF